MRSIASKSLQTTFWGVLGIVPSEHYCSSSTHFRCSLETLLQNTFHDFVFYSRLVRFLFGFVDLLCEVLFQVLFALLHHLFDVIFHSPFDFLRLHFLDDPVFAALQFLFPDPRQRHANVVELVQQALNSFSVLHFVELPIILVLNGCASPTGYLFTFRRYFDITSMYS